jgi:hypothetical protein
MAYLDADTLVNNPDAEEERRRQMLGLLVGRPRTSILGNRDANQPSSTLAPGSRDYNLAVGATSQPTIPTPRTVPAEPPTVGNPSFPSSGPLGGAPQRPMRPDVMPTREDYPAKPEVGGWKKYLGLGLAALSGPRTAGPLAEGILHGQRDRADTQYQGAVQDWEREQTDAARAATTAHTQAETYALGHPKPDKPEGLTNQEAQAVEELVAQGVPRVDAIGKVKGAGQKPPTPTFEEQGYAQWSAAQKAAGKPFDYMTFEKEKAGATQKPEHEPRQLMEVQQPDGSVKVVEARPGMTLPKGAKKVGATDKGPTADEQRRADLGNNLNENLAAYEDIVRRRPDLFGPIAGRKTAALMFTGSSDPDISALRAIKEFAGMAAVGTHAMRNAQHVKIASDAMMNLNDQPEAILSEKGPISRARTSIQTFIGDVEGQRVQDKGALHSFTFNGTQYENVPDALYNKYKGKAGFKE